MEQFNPGHQANYPQVRGLEILPEPAPETEDNLSNKANFFRVIEVDSARGKSDPGHR